MTSDRRLVSSHFPRSSKYHPEWVLASASGGANALWLTEWLSETLDLHPGCECSTSVAGGPASSIFLRREFGVDVWAADLWFSPSENMERIRDAGVEGGVFPNHADARSLPFATEFFDAIVGVDSFPYFGTDDPLSELSARFVKPGGQLGIAGAGLVQEIGVRSPITCVHGGPRICGALHSADWWRRHWERPGSSSIAVADTMPDGWERGSTGTWPSRRTTKPRFARSARIAAGTSATSRVAGAGTAKSCLPITSSRYRLKYTRSPCFVRSRAPDASPLAADQPVKLQLRTRARGEVHCRFW